MNENCVIKTERLVIHAATDEEMRLLVENEKNAELKEAYSQMLELSVKCPEKREWYAAWFIELKDGKRVGDLGFKGLNDDGSVEIGYGLLEEYQGRGYAAEAVIAATEWASRRDGVTRIEAETDDDNVRSKRVLEKAGYVPTGEYGEEGPRFVWKGKAR